MPTKKLKDFCPGSLLEGRAEILQIFGWHFGRNDDLSFVQPINNTEIKWLLILILAENCTWQINKL
jgi:hypothetical protein